MNEKIEKLVHDLRRKENCNDLEKQFLIMHTSLYLISDMLNNEEKQLVSSQFAIKHIKRYMDLIK